MRYRRLVAGFLMALLLTGCAANPDAANPIETTRPLEEIKSTGITPQDVIAAYDELVKDLFRAKYNSQENRESLYYDLDEHTMQFDYFSPMEYPVQAGPWKLPYYFMENNSVGFIPQHSWITDTGSMFYNPNIPPLYDVYPISIKYTVSVRHLSDEMLVMYAGIAKEPMEKFFAAYGLEGYVMTIEKAKELDERAYTRSLSLLDETVYEPLTIDRAMLEQSSEEQLWAVYNLLESIYSINFYGELPQEGKNYSVEIP